MYDVVIDFAAYLKNPSSVSVRGIYNVNKELLINRNRYDYVIEISAMNGFGGYSIEYLNWDGNSNYNHSTSTIVSGENIKYHKESIDRINKAIEEYFSN